jgi:hypothetical protein
VGRRSAAGNPFAAGATKAACATRFDVRRARTSLQNGDRVGGLKFETLSVYESKRF